MGTLCIFALLLTLLVSCTIPLKNSKWTVDAGPDGAYWFMMFTKEHGHVDKATWDKAPPKDGKEHADNRFGQLCATPSVFANLKEVIENICQNSNQCTFDVRQKKDVFFSNIAEAAQSGMKGNGGK